MLLTFNEDNFHSLCDGIAATDLHLKGIIDKNGYPPFWARTPTFATLIHIILEQQVSLASAKAAFLKLQEKIGHITPVKVLALTDEELKACYFSRQKIKYTRHLATEVAEGRLLIESLEQLGNDDIRHALKKIKGIGDWTVDVFLMMVLHRTDVFPPGDIALLKSIKEVKGLPADTPKEQLMTIADSWKPYRTVAAYLLWHAYLERRKAVSQITISSQKRHA
jgi:DNA-3-methyladenine glycosylase II